MRQENLVAPLEFDKEKTSKSTFLSTTALIKAAVMSAVMGMSAIGTAHAQVTTCAYGEPREFNNGGSIIFEADPSNSQLFTATSVQNGQTFNLTVLDKSPSSNPLLTPISGTNHSQNGGSATNGGIRFLGTAASNGTTEADLTVDISGGFVTSIELYSHDIENGEYVSFGALDYVAGSLQPHPGATIGVDAQSRTALGTANNTNGSGDRSAFAEYENINGLTTLTQTQGVNSGRLGTGVALGTYCVSIVESVAEVFPEFTGAGGVTASVIASDTLNGEVIDPADVTFTPGDITGPDGNPSMAITLNIDGTITVPAGIQPGDYTVEYQICDKVNATNCFTATETITVTASPSLSITKVADNTGPHRAGESVTYTYTVINDGDRVIRGVAISDTHNGSDPAPTPGNETLLTDAGTQGDSTDAAVDGSWDVLAPGDVLTFTGTYTITATDVVNLQ